MNLKSNTSLTLTELLITTIIFGVIMVGIASMDVALRQTHRGSSVKAFISMRTSAAMLHITKNVERATGSQADPGIITGSGALWLRIDQNTPPTPGDYSDDTWVSYEEAGSILFYCSNCPPPSQCTVINPSPERILEGVSVFLPNFVQNASTGELYLETTLTNRADILQPADPFNNPDSTLTTRIYPASSGF